MYGGRREVHTGFWWGNLKEEYCWGNKGKVGKILNWILRKLDGMVWTGFIWLRIGTMAGHSETGKATKIY